MEMRRRTRSGILLTAHLQTRGTRPNQDTTRIIKLGCTSRAVTCIKLCRACTRVLMNFITAHEFVAVRFGALRMTQFGRAQNQTHHCLVELCRVGLQPCWPRDFMTRTASDFHRIGLCDCVVVYRRCSHVLISLAEFIGYCTYVAS